MANGIVSRRHLTCPAKSSRSRRGAIERLSERSLAASCRISRQQPGEAEIQYAVQVRITPRPGILDPQGETIGRALGTLGYDGVTGVRMGRLVSLQVEAANETAARASVTEMCERLIANPIIEDFSILIQESD
ncbi:MAG: phosphoribosylformylglycinamidine synthase subunit PurS [Gemmatimonadales bacterium]|nr:MAG: phosphoribosylformylglycinamidine synthase subunit PurS [Gemmatimonadales bacterium]